MLAACAPGVAALDPARPIPQYTHAWYQEQLPQNTVLGIAQRRDGSMWFATYSGVARHSGAEFRVIDRRSATQLESTAITALLEDTGGTLWIATLNGGLYRMAADAEQPERVALPAPVESVFALAQDARGTIWLGTNDGVLQLSGGTTRRYGPAEGIAPVPIRSMASDRAGGVWVALDGAGVAHFHDGRLDLLGVAEGLPDPGVFAVHADREGTVWAGTQRGLVRYRDGRFEPVPGAEALDGERIYTVLGDRDGNLWATADGKGLCRLNAAGFECAPAIEGLSHDVVRSMYEDREGNLWIGATTSGVHRISDAKLATTEGTLESNSIRALHEDAAGTLWAGTDGAGLARVRDGTLVRDPVSDRLGSAFVRTIGSDAHGALWVGTIVGLSRIGPDGAVVNHEKSDGLPGAIVFALAPDGPDALWIGTTGGLARMRDGRIAAVDATGPHDTRSLHVDRRGTLWIGQRSGLQCLRGEVVDRCGTPDGLSNTSVFAFHEADDGAMWIGTSKGLVRMQDGRLARYTEREGLADDDVFALLDDGQGHFWTSSNRGLARTAKADFDAFDAGTIPALRPQRFGKHDGMRSSQANGASQSPAVRTRDGRLHFATTRGVVTANPARLRPNPLPPPVVIERVVVDSTEHATRAVSRIGPGVERLEFHYAGMSYIAPEAVRYRYRLDGYDRDWIDAGARRAAYYTNLRPGRYAFHVIASNNDGVWSEQGAAMRFAIVPRWFETAWFRALLVLAAIAAIVAVYRVRVWRVRSNERELTRLVALQTNALRDANAELQRIASLDGLTRIANRAAFDATLAQLWDEHRARGASLAFVLCDIDEFKAYNDSYGHQAGDAALIRVAAVLHTAARDGGIAARYGGEEFALLLPDHTLEQAGRFARQLLESVRALEIPHRASTIAGHLTASIGVTALVPAQGTTPEQAVRAADEALYRAKREGRDRVVESAMAGSAAA
ncbi:MAG TPA: two-component regulator propeller domain-containing protein [Xanthomonadales bacterium]|nr:two-component regulator propeller domain-containing protein [Xanthomonadales bacterium]